MFKSWPASAPRPILPEPTIRRSPRSRSCGFDQLETRTAMSVGLGPAAAALYSPPPETSTQVDSRLESLVKSGTGADAAQSPDSSKSSLLSSALLADLSKSSAFINTAVIITGGSGPDAGPADDGLAYPTLDLAKSLKAAISSLPESALFPFFNQLETKFDAAPGSGVDVPSVISSVIMYLRGYGLFDQSPSAGFEADLIRSGAEIGPSPFNAWGNEAPIHLVASAAPSAGLEASTVEVQDTGRLLSITSSAGEEDASQALAFGENSAWFWEMAPDPSVPLPLLMAGGNLPDLVAGGPGLAAEVDPFVEPRMAELEPLEDSSLAMVATLRSGFADLPGEPTLRGIPATVRAGPVEDLIRSPRWIDYVMDQADALEQGRQACAGLLSGDPKEAGPGEEWPAWCASIGSASEAARRSDRPTLVEVSEADRASKPPSSEAEEPILPLCSEDGPTTDAGEGEGLPRIEWSGGLAWSALGFGLAIGWLRLRRRRAWSWWGG